MHEEERRRSEYQVSKVAHEILLVVRLISAKHFLQGTYKQWNCKNLWNAVYSVAVYEERKIYVQQK